MEEIGKRIEEARALLASGHEPKAVQILGDAIEATDDPALLEEIHELAIEGHEQVGGFQKIHWHALMIDSEARIAQAREAQAAGAPGSAPPA